MTINHFLTNLIKVSRKLYKNNVLFERVRPAYFIGGTLLFLIVYFSFLINENLKEKRAEQISSFLSNNQTVLLKNYIFNKIKSPYLEYDYIVKNNDTIESILKKFSVKRDEIAFVVKKIKTQKLSNISPGQKIQFILKKSSDGKDLEIFKINYPISKTTFVRIDKRKDGINVSKNITQLFKKNVVVEGRISNNLYSSATSSGMEPSIIIEFARIFGFEVDFQRDIRKGDKFQVMYERYLDDRNKQIKTGKILYAYLNVNNQKIKLYRFETKNDFDFYDEKGRSIRKA